MFSVSSPSIRSIRNAARRCESLSHDALKQHSLQLKYSAMRGQLGGKFAKAFGFVTEAIRRHANLTYYDVQLTGGLAMARGGIAEMKTGEGKTITAVLPAYFFGLSGLGCHVVTVNDYLAQRDFELLRPVYESLGLSVGVILSEHTPEERAAAYRRDVTYGTAKEFGFDFLRDRMSAWQAETHASPAAKTQRDLHAVVIDEVDSVLLDEARTPLILGTIDSLAAAQNAVRYRWAAELAEQFHEGSDFRFDEQRNRIELLPTGFQRLGQLPQNDATRAVSLLELKQHIEQAIHVRRNFALDQHYAIDAGKVAIIDEFTGRVAEGRQWQAGIHQSIEAKEGLEVSPKTESAASVTVQHYFRLYQHKCGMTGTATTARREFKRVYDLRVTAIPTARPVNRQRMVPRVFADTTTKFHAVRDEIREMTSLGRAVLVGTRSVEKSETLSALLNEDQIEHRVLNARHIAEEATIVEQAGQPQTVTVATNMAGRGTDILLHPEVHDAGGLHVLLTEIHESKRIDLQLIGRCSRQGDLGSYRIFVSMDDEILKLGFGEDAAAKLFAKYASSSCEELSYSLFRKFVRAQSLAEAKHRVDRMALLRREKDQLERMFETGQDPYLDLLR